MIKTKRTPEDVIHHVGNYCLEIFGDGQMQHRWVLSKKMENIKIIENNINLLERAEQKGQASMKADILKEIDKIIKVESWKAEEFIISIGGKPFGSTISRAVANYMEKDLKQLLKQSIQKIDAQAETSESLQGCDRKAMVRYSSSLEGNNNPSRLVSETSVEKPCECRVTHLDAQSEQERISSGVQPLNRNQHPASDKGCGYTTHKGVIIFQCGVSAGSCPLCRSKK